VQIFATAIAVLFRCRQVVHHSLPNQMPRQVYRFTKT
jgi:hypothetical protein